MDRVCLLDKISVASEIVTNELLQLLLNLLQISLLLRLHLHLHRTNRLPRFQLCYLPIKGHL